MRKQFEIIIDAKRIPHLLKFVGHPMSTADIRTAANSLGDRVSWMVMNKTVKVGARLGLIVQDPQTQCWTLPETVQSTPAAVAVPPLIPGAKQPASFTGNVPDGPNGKSHHHVTPGAE